MTYKTRQVEGEGGLGKQKGGAKAARVQDPALGRGGSWGHLDRAGAEHDALERTEFPFQEFDLPPRPRASWPALGTLRGPRRDRRRRPPEDRRQGLRGLRPRVARLLGRLARRAAGGYHPGPDLHRKDALICMRMTP